MDRSRCTSDRAASDVVPPRASRGCVPTPHSREASGRLTRSLHIDTIRTYLIRTYTPPAFLRSEHTMTTPPSTADTHLPLKPVVFHILLGLAEGSSHGYGVIQAVREHSEGRIHLETGPFYRHLKRLLEDGLVQDSQARPDNVDPRRGRYYELTGLGEAVVKAEQARLGRLLALSRELTVQLEGGT